MVNWMSATFGLKELPHPRNPIPVHPITLARGQPLQVEVTSIQERLTAVPLLCAKTPSDCRRLQKRETFLLDETCRLSPHSPQQPQERACFKCRP